MNNRPASITIIGYLFIAVGAVALTYHLLPQHIDEADSGHPIPYALVWICLVRTLAIVSGAFILRGFNRARWLLVIWMAYHIVLSALHSLSEVAVHTMLFGMIVWFLFRPPAAAFFRHRVAERPSAAKTDRPPVA